MTTRIEKALSIQHSAGLSAGLQKIAPTFCHPDRAKGMRTVSAMVIIAASFLIGNVPRAIDLSLEAAGGMQGVNERLSRGFRIRSKPIDFDQDRVDLSLAYRRQHQDPAAKDITIDPRIIVLHWTAISTFDSTWSYFNRKRVETGRTRLAAAGEVNVSAHFL